MSRQFIAAVIVAAAVMTGACQPAPESPVSTRTSTSAASVPPGREKAARSIEAIGHHAEDLYDHARLQDWQNCAIDVDGLREAAALLGADEGTHNVQSQIMPIDSAITRRDPRALMHLANDLTRQSAEMMRPYSPGVPVDVTLLDFYGREIELAAAENDLPRLQSTRESITSAWSSLRETVTKRGGEAQAVRFDSVVEKLAQARTAEEFGATATPILDEVDVLEGVFTR